MRVGKFDPRKLVQEKEAARRADDEQLDSGRVSPAEMRKRNEFLYHLDFSEARIVLGDVDAEL